jgi:hypothetical protein
MSRIFEGIHVDVAGRESLRPRFLLPLPAAESDCL